MSRKLDCVNELDKEWLQLILEAKSMGMDLNTIRDFLHVNSVKELVVEK
ncbi:anti-repressor SinI family protein [Neobacillus sp. D3-1R]